MQVSPLVALALLLTTANVELQRAETAYRQLEFDRALSHLDAARLAEATNSEYQRIVELTAFVHVIYERHEAALASFDELLRLRPDYTPPADASPKIIAAYEEAAAARRARAAVVAPLPVSALDAQVPSSPPVATPVWRRWWFWTGAAVLATGALVAALYLTRDQTPAHDFGPFEVRLPP